MRREFTAVSPNHAKAFRRGKRHQFFGRSAAGSFHEEVALPAGERKVDFRQQPGVKQRAVQRTGRIINPVAGAERVEAVFSAPDASFSQSPEYP